MEHWIVFIECVNSYLFVLNSQESQATKAVQTQENGQVGEQNGHLHSLQ